MHHYVPLFFSRVLEMQKESFKPTPTSKACLHRSFSDEDLIYVEKCNQLPEKDYVSKHDTEIDFQPLMMREPKATYLMLDGLVKTLYRELFIFSVN